MEFNVTMPGSYPTLVDFELLQWLFWVSTIARTLTQLSLFSLLVLGAVSLGSNPGVKSPI